MQLDVPFISANEVDSVKVKILDGSNLTMLQCIGEWGESEQFEFESSNGVLQFDVVLTLEHATIYLLDDNLSAADVGVLEVSYLKDGNLVGSSLVQSGSCELKLLKYKVELPRGAKVTLFDDETLEAQFLSWNLPCPKTLPNMTFLQVKAANGFEQQITPQAGSYTVELYSELGRRYAVFGEIWSYSYSQTLWFADLKIQKSDYEWQGCVPTAGEGGTIVTALPQ